MGAGHILVLGGANLDTTATAGAALHRGDSTPGRVRSSPGGVARNVAENLARLGHDVRLVSAVGDDPAGHALLAATARAGVDVSACHMLAGEATASYVSLHHGNGTLMAAVNDMQVLERLVPDMLAPLANAVRAASLLLLDCNLSEAALAWLFDQRANASINATVFADAVSGAKCERLRPWLPRLHTLKLNRIEARALSGLPTDTAAEVEAAADWLHAEGVANVVLSLGGQGLFFSATGCADDTAPHQRGHLPALPVAVLNTSGAGDALLAGLVHSHLLKAPLAEAARFANACAALTLGTPSTIHPDLSAELVAQCLHSHVAR